MAKKLMIGLVANEEMTDQIIERLSSPQELSKAFSQCIEYAILQSKTEMILE
jgi:hypothetical protein